MCVTCRKNPFLKLTTDGVTDHSERNELHLFEKDQDPVPTCIEFVRRCCNAALGFISCLSACACFDVWY